MSNKRGVLDNDQFDLDKYLQRDADIHGEHNDDRLELQRLESEIINIKE